MSAEFKRTFPSWFKERVKELHVDDQRTKFLRELSIGPNYQVVPYRGCYVNGYRFHGINVGEGLSTNNSGVVVRGSCYGENHLDYYGILNEVLEVEYFISGPNKLILFSCDWFDPSGGVIVDSVHDIVDVVPGKYIRRFEPFVIASQVEQVCYVSSVGRKRKKDGRLTVIKINPRPYFENNDDAVDNEGMEAYEPQYRHSQPVETKFEDDTYEFKNTLFTSTSIEILFAMF